MDSMTSPPMSTTTTSTSSIFSPLLISMLGIVGTSIAIVIYHLLLVKYCIRRNTSTVTEAQTTATPQPPTGIDEKVLETIPILKFSAAKLVNDDMTDLHAECVVCLGELEDHDTVRLLPNCNHAFHASCIDQWFAAHDSCPLCRSPVIGETDHAPKSLELQVVTIGNSGRESNNSEYFSVRSTPSPRGRSVGLLRHCASLVLPSPAERRRSAASRLKRSVSMDQSLHVIVNVLQSVNCSSDTTSCSSSGSGGLTSARSLSHFDRVSSKWLRSLSRLRGGKGSNGALLPY